MTENMPYFLTNRFFDRSTITGLMQFGIAIAAGAKGKCPQEHYQSGF
jgi:hypothetical protein